MLPLLAPVDPAAPEHDEQLYHTRGWYRDLWLESLGIEADPPAQGEAAD